MAIRIGFIGGGNVAAGHLNALSQIEGVQCVAMCELDEDLLEDRCEEYGLKACKVHEEVIAESDAVFVVTPPTFRREPVEAAAKAGVHVFSEKPMALTLEDADAMQAACDRAGVVLQIGFNFRYDPLMRKALELKADGTLGEVVYCWDRQVIHRADTAWAAKAGARDAWRLSTAASGGRIFEFCSHKLDWMMALGGEPASVFGRSASISPTLKSAGMDDTDLALLTFSEGGYGVLELCMSPHGVPRSSVGVMGSEASAETTADGKLLLMRSGADEPETLAPEPAHQDRHRHFISCVQTGDRPLTDGAVGRANVAMCLAFNESAASGKVVDLQRG